MNDGNGDILLELERRFWTEGANFYEERLAPDAALVFPDPVGVMGKEETVRSLAEATRWSEIDMSDVRVIDRPGMTLLVYRAAARRSDSDSAYTALATSAYARRDGAWMMLLHQQTPTG